ncbi:hypothetical protein GOHSU_29_00120 [Gordonia hirsuta DSM 44140 = NBRC 16056]|uniref:Uncharacterized protein n=1 Tax=Gordonia hirsuta DSM 44140 = NBRC 16056 TaxID=1121927 RepID=L7LAV7_9ACTN|nr:DUF732 domain-containing protein [Gordonia hirsuta]GAC58029.1 hypothetical protein GOHSU_29_00120 [Gordonia hirsuta DSM 44140 = NBRC 16056]
MTGKFSRGLVLCAALVATAVGISACGDSSTATAPLTQDATIATMPGHSPAASAGSAEQSAASSAAAASSSAHAAASRASTELPATKPEASSSAPGNPEGGRSDLTDKEKKYLAALERDKVSFMGDDDKNVALTWGHYVCQERKKKTDPTVIRVYVRAGVGPMTKSEQEAGVQADKLIAAAEKNLC